MTAPQPDPDEWPIDELYQDSVIEPPELPRPLADPSGFDILRGLMRPTQGPRKAHPPVLVTREAELRDRAVKALRDEVTGQTRRRRAL